ncbi:uncharacterized protein LOC119579383 isoform X2 [Penaeus monodon]|uniref:uncharacterized protein LOC119579383 isoform X2 n=1 Tax=Penaeus monodon TaxID=6687 RepID=UPI0018A75135|nr:uncharacterized protein LOC119579383 isoform X2 [Penaeus monodon]
MEVRDDLLEVIPHIDGGEGPEAEVGNGERVGEEEGFGGRQRGEGGGGGGGGGGGDGGGGEEAGRKRMLGGIIGELRVKLQFLSHLCSKAFQWYLARPEVGFTWTLLTTAANQGLILLTTLRFSRNDVFEFQSLALAFHGVSYVAVCMFSSERLHKLYNWQVWFSAIGFLVAPYMLLVLSITHALRLRKARKTDGTTVGNGGVAGPQSVDEKLNAVTSLRSLWGVLAAAPLVYLQITVANAAEDKDLYYLAVSVNVSLLKASAAQLGSVAVDWVWKVFGIASVMASMGSRAWLVASLYKSPGLWRYACWAPLATGFLATWLARCVSRRTLLVSPVDVLRKAIVLPPADAEGACGAAPFFLAAAGLFLTRPWSAVILLAALAVCQGGGAWLWRAMFTMHEEKEEEEVEDG